MTQVVVFGHSITHGYWDTEGGWVRRLRGFLDSRALEEQEEELVYYLYELGVGGDTVLDILDRFEEEMKSRFEPEEENVIIIQAGANDFMKEEGRQLVSEEKFSSGFRRLLEEADNFADEIMIVGDGYTSIEGQIPYDPGMEMSDEGMKKAHRIRREVAEEKEIPYVSIREEFEKEEWVEKLEDGIHPGNTGHAAIYRMVRERLESEKIV